MKRALKAIIAIILIIAVLCCSAYFTVKNILDNVWQANAISTLLEATYEPSVGIEYVDNDSFDSLKGKLLAGSVDIFRDDLFAVDKLIAFNGTVGEITLSASEVASFVNLFFSNSSVRNEVSLDFDLLYCQISQIQGIRLQNDNKMTFVFKPALSKVSNATLLSSSVEYNLYFTTTCTVSTNPLTVSSISLVINNLVGDNNVNAINYLQRYLIDNHTFASLITEQVGMAIDVLNCIANYLNATFTWSAGGFVLSGQSDS